MKDPDPRPAGAQGNPGDSEPPLSPKAAEVHREEEKHAGERAQEPRRIPEPVSQAHGFADCAARARRTLGDIVACHPCGTLAVFFAAGLLCGFCAARMDSR